MDTLAAAVTTAFSTFIDQQIGVEGGYSDPAETGEPDAGGVTIWGITETIALSCGYTAQMRLMPRGTAASIYLRYFVQRPGFDRAGMIDLPIALKLAEIGIMSGPGTAVKMLQRTLNALDERGTLFASLRQDGDLGEVTLGALGKVIAARGADARHVVLAMVLAMQSVFLVELCERNPSQEAFEYGWQLNRVVGGQLQQIGAAGGTASGVTAHTASPAATAAAIRSTT